MKISKLILTFAALALSTGAHHVAVAQGTGQVIGKAKLAGGGPVATAELIVSSAGGIQNVVVTIEGFSGQLADTPILIDQREKVYHNRISVTNPGSLVTIRNSDAVMHNVNAKQNGRATFNMAMPRQNQETKKRFRRPGLVEFRCDVHPEMRAFVFVADTPYHALTNESGLFEIGDVPAGVYLVKAWHETLGVLEATVTVKVGQKVPAIFEFEPPAPLESSDGQ